MQSAKASATSSNPLAPIWTPSALPPRPVSGRPPGTDGVSVGISVVGSAVTGAMVVSGVPATVVAGVVGAAVVVTGVVATMVVGVVGATVGVPGPGVGATGTKAVLIAFTGRGCSTNAGIACTVASS